jgi:DHA2 family multidrug resistance protein
MEILRERWLSGEPIHVSLLEPATRNRLADLQQYFMSHGFPDPAGALHRAIIAVGQTIRAQATIMGYADSFALLGVALIIAILPVACSERAPPPAALDISPW